MYYLTYFYFVNNDVSHQVEFYNNVKSCEIRAIQMYDEYLEKLKLTFSFKINEDILYLPSDIRSISKFESDVNKHYFTYEIGKMPNGDDDIDSFYNTSSSDTESVNSK